MGYNTRLPLIYGKPIDHRFQINGVSVLDAEILGFPNNDRYVLVWQVYPPNDSNYDEMTAYRTSISSNAIKLWCLTAYTLIGYEDYCANPGGDPVISTRNGWIDETGLREFISSHHGKIWQIGNEPFTKRPAGEMGITPGEYTIWYRDAYTLIKSIDPTAQVGFYGMGMFDAERDFLLQFLNRYLALYHEPAKSDFMAIHHGAFPGQWTPQGEISLVTEKINWLEGYRGILWSGPRNYWITEYGMPAYLVPIPENEAIQYMLALTGWFKTNDIGITGWGWWPSSSKLWPENTRLVNRGKPTRLGEVYYQEATKP